MSYPVRPPARVRDCGDVILASRRAVARLTRRHPDQVRRHCRPVACDVATRAALYDAETSCDTLGRLRWR